MAGVRERGIGDDENGLLALASFGPGKLPRMARNLGEFVRKARHSVDEFESELAFEEDQAPHHREFEVTLSTCWPNRHTPELLSIDAAIRRAAYHKTFSHELPRPTVRAAKPHEGNRIISPISTN